MRIHQNDLCAEREKPNPASSTTSIILRDNDEGRYLGRLHPNFTDEQVQAAVKLANDWYEEGKRHGRIEAQEIIRAALGIMQ